MFLKKFEGKYKDLPESVRKVFTEKEFETLVLIQDSFIESAEYVNRILKNDDLEGNLRYVVNDWLGEHGKDYLRNDSLVAELKQISAVYDRLIEKVRKQEKLDEQTGFVAEVGNK